MLAQYSTRSKDSLKKELLGTGIKSSENIIKESYTFPCIQGSSNGL